LRRSSVSDRNNIDINKHVLRLNFEDLVLNYNDSILRIKDFLEIDMQHNQKLMHFDPSYSIKNIGLWREYKNQSIMHDIGSELKDYCCNDNRISN
jgi:hypothetical protein